MIELGERHTAIHFADTPGRAPALPTTRGTPVEFAFGSVVFHAASENGRGAVEKPFAPKFSQPNSEVWRADGVATAPRTKARSGAKANMVEAAWCMVKLRDGSKPMSLLEDF